MRALKSSLQFAPYEDVPYGTLSTALDYRIGYYFEITEPRWTMAYQGAIRISQVFEGRPSISLKPRQPFGSAQVMSQIAVWRFFDSLDEALRHFQPKGRILDDDEEEELLRYCLVLALFEQCARATPRKHSPLFTTVQSHLSKTY